MSISVSAADIDAFLEIRLEDRAMHKVVAARFLREHRGLESLLAQASPSLSSLIDKRLGMRWRTDLFELVRLREWRDDPEFRKAFHDAKFANKLRLVERAKRDANAIINPEALFDLQVKRIHEYKRQLLNILYVIVRYNRIRENPEKDWTPRVVMFAGKAASAYKMAKNIIKLINDVAKKINADPLVGDRLKVGFIPNYGVSVAELIIPAADLSEQILMAGTEASGTGNRSSRSTAR